MTVKLLTVLILLPNIIDCATLFIPWTTYFTTESLCPLILTSFAHPSSLSVYYQFVFCSSFVLFVHLFGFSHFTSKITQYFLSISLSLSLSLSLYIYIYMNVYIYIYIYTYIYICMKVLLVQSCPTLCDPMDCSLRGFSVHGIFQEEYWVGCHFLLQQIFPTQGVNQDSCIGMQILYCWAATDLYVC